MVFSSLPFLILFLPITVFTYYFLLRHDYNKYAIPFLFLASLFFYAHWKPSYLFIILFSIAINFFLGQAINRYVYWRKFFFVLGISINLLLLGYFKYTVFLLETIGHILQTPLSISNIILPIGISFYTFQQIAYLSDVYTKKHIANTSSFWEYATFVCFFPQLIAGPIVHHAEMMPQFKNEQNKTLQWENIYKGLCFLGFGLAKKVLIADNLSALVQYGFDEASSLSFLEALFSSIAYTLQLYFDFSGYADMAIGCALFFNIKLPFNFDSPYKALTIQDFWRRWHITLSRWLRDYLYIPLGGNKGNTVRTMGNLFLTFLLGGIWHGAGWTFALWGILHGIVLILHRVWSRVLGYKMPNILAWIMTFSFVSSAWIPFRAINFERMNIFIDAFLGHNGFFIGTTFSKTVSNLWGNAFIVNGGVIEYSIAMLFLLIICLTSKNSQNLIRYTKLKSLNIYVALLLTFSIITLLIPGYSPEFIYFQF